MLVWRVFTEPCPQLQVKVLKTNKKDISKQYLLSTVGDNKSSPSLRLSRPLLYRDPCRRACQERWQGLEYKPMSLAKSSQASMCQDRPPPLHRLLALLTLPLLGVTEATPF